MSESMLRAMVLRPSASQERQAVSAGLGRWLLAALSGAPAIIAPMPAPMLASQLLAPLAISVAVAGCGGAAPLETERYPEKKRPEPLRSASDGEVMGANQQSPEDTLEASVTNEHAAPKGPGAEKPEAEVAQERLEHERCEKENSEAQKAGADGAASKKKRLCPPAPPAPGN